MKYCENHNLHSEDDFYDDEVTEQDVMGEIYNKSDFITIEYSRMYFGTVLTILVTDHGDSISLHYGVNHHGDRRVLTQVTSKDEESLDLKKDAMMHMLYDDPEMFIKVFQ